MRRDEDSIRSAKRSQYWVEILPSAPEVAKRTSANPLPIPRDSDIPRTIYLRNISHAGRLCIDETVYLFTRHSMVPSPSNVILVSFSNIPPCLAKYSWTAAAILPANFVLVPVGYDAWSSR